MSALSSIVYLISHLGTNLMSSLGYSGLLVAMALESMIFPLPSELVMPFAGYLIAIGRFSWLGVIIFSTVGSIIGSLAFYWVGKYGGQALILKYGRYLLLDETDLIKTEAWFFAKGEKTIFIGRFIPVVRHLISLPAGLGKMNLKKFCFYTITGAALWNTLLAYLGYILGTNWEEVRQYSEYISLAVFIALVVVLVYFIYRHVNNKKIK